MQKYDVDKLEMEYSKELAERREVAINYKGQVAGRHPDLFGHSEMQHMIRGYLEGFEKAKSTLYTEEQVQKMIDDALTNYEIGWADRKKQFSLYEHKETITSADTPVSNSFLNSTSSQPQLYTEEQLKLAYMQGYNRGKDGNPNHMESYIQFLKQPKKD